MWLTQQLLHFGGASSPTGTLKSSLTQSSHHFIKTSDKKASIHPFIFNTWFFLNQRFQGGVVGLPEPTTPESIN